MVLLENNKKNLYVLSSYIEDVDGDFGINLLSKIPAREYSSKLLRYGHVLAIIENDKLLAILGFYANDNIYHKSFISILSVRNMYRGKGFAKMLVEKYIEFCKNNNMKSLYVDSVNPIAVSLYTSFGFEVYKTEDINGLIKKYLLKYL